MRCLTPVTAFAARPPMHEQGSFVGTPRPDVPMSRWRFGPTTMGPVGRVVSTIALLLILPWWAISLPLVSIWRKERVADGAPPTSLDRFRARHPALGREIHLGPTARLAIASVAAIAVVVVFLTKDDVERYLFAAPILIVGLTLSLAKWNDV
jgi:predicted membrane protein